MARSGQAQDWSLLTGRGSVLFYVALHPGCTINEIAREASLTRRAVWGVVGDLRRAGMLQVGRAGREHRYSVDLDGPFLHPTIKGVTLRTVLGRIARQRPAQALAAS